MKDREYIRIADNAEGINSIWIEVALEDKRECGTVWIDEVPYHIERMTRAKYMRKYPDIDDGEKPRGNDNNQCSIIIPFAG